MIDGCVVWQCCVPPPALRVEYLRAIAYVVCALHFDGRSEVAARFFEEATTRCEQWPADARGTGWLCFGRLMNARFATGDPWAERAAALEGARAFDEGQDAAGQVHMSPNRDDRDHAWALRLSDWAQSRRAVELARQFDLALFLPHGFGVAAIATARLGRPAEANAIAAEGEATCERQVDQVYHGYGTTLLAQARRLAGEPARAQEACRRALERVTLVATRSVCSSRAPPRCWGLATHRGAGLLQRGDGDRPTESVAWHSRAAIPGDGLPRVRCARAEGAGSPRGRTGGRPHRDESGADPVPEIRSSFLELPCSRAIADFLAGRPIDPTLAAARL